MDDMYFSIHAVSRSKLWIGLYSLVLQYDSRYNWTVAICIIAIYITSCTVDFVWSLCNVNEIRRTRVVCLLTDTISQSKVRLVHSEFMINYNSVRLLHSTDWIQYTTLIIYQILWLQQLVIHTYTLIRILIKNNLVTPIHKILWMVTPWLTHYLDFLLVNIFSVRPCLISLDWKSTKHYIIVML